MGDPVGIASLGIQVCHGLLQYYKTWKDYKDDIEATYERIESFEQTLLLLCNTINQRGPSPDLLNQVADCIQACRDGIARLSAKFEKIKERTPDESAMNILRRQIHFQSQRLIYPFRASTLAKLREITTELQSNLLAAATVLNIDLTASALERLEILDNRTSSLVSESASIRGSVSNVERQAGEILQVQTDSKYQKACEWLSAPNPIIEYSKALKDHHPGTISWFVNSEETFESWKTLSRSTYWIHGKPGCGKTVLSAVIISHLKENVLPINNGSLAYFFFNTNDRPKTKVEGLVRSLAFQLALQTTNGQKEILDLYSNHRDGQKDLDQATLQAFLKNQLAQGPVYLLFDALDECEDASELLNLIQTILSWQVDHLRMIFTSRNDDYLRVFLDSLVMFEIDMGNAHLKADLEVYIRERVNNDEQLGAWSPDIQEEIISSIGDGADGMFRWVALQLDEVTKCYTLDGLRKTLKSLPQDLESTYIRILSEIPEASQHVVQRLLLWIVSAEVPLDLVAAAETVKLNIEDSDFYSEDRRLRSSRTLLRLCPSLITLTQKDDLSGVECLTLAHASVREFLLSERLRNTPLNSYHFSMEQASIYVAESCVAYLVHVANTQLDLTENWYWTTFKKFPLLEYARIFWDTHTRKVQSADTKRLNTLVIDYFSSSLVTKISESFTAHNMHPHDLSPLIRMAEYGLVNGLQGFIDQGANINSTTNAGWTALSVAVSSERPIIVQTLLENGASPNCSAGDCMTACGLAVRMTVGLLISSNTSNCHEITTNLLRHGAALAPGEPMSVWQEALEYEEASTIQELLALNVDALFQADNNVPLLHCAVSMHLHRYHGMVRQGRPATLVAALVRDDLEKVRLILDNKTVVDAMGEDNRTPLVAALHKAAQFDGPHQGLVIEVCELLLDSGADVHAQDAQGWTPLHWAAAYLNENVVSMFLRCGGGGRWLSTSCQTALHVAIIYGNDESVIRTLLEYDLPLDIIDDNGNTALGYAILAFDERPSIVEMLVQYGANMDDEN
ncbi:Ankyrin repeat-containing protein [Glarea lozoyensis ATCC 20868]|uniref:Ankyrin repeat-containing protein n=1 Tax=Glarea lozoyensis (strain ATCC 20868 / MF5171) TaxID=1116229 RepID=S3CND5_GLAL2|nr:Ankyrin repeat-containing protein [Glarea lozoyensis ATCC 20868]EPE28002.1 Ankyrin repeat-containing protein [Glarea lozoyensis ATCC 20868]